MLLRIGKRIINTDHIVTVLFHPDQRELQISEVGATSTWSLKGRDAEATWAFLTSQAVDVLVEDEPSSQDDDPYGLKRVCACGHTRAWHSDEGGCGRCECRGFDGGRY